MGDIILDLQGHSEYIMDKLHILVVDDNHINRLFFQSSLKKLNCAVTTANNGFEAIAACKINKFDLILMDIRMNGMNGIESAAQIKQLKTHHTTPIVAISAESFNTDKQKDFSQSLLKPVKQEVLAQTIARHSQRLHYFNHELALQISHDDEEIVQHLRKIFTEQLNQVNHDLTELYAKNDYAKLNQSLHKLLGSAKICAAEQMVDEILDFKENLSESKFNKLLTTIDKMRRQSI